MTIGQHIKEARKNAGLTQKALAKKIGAATGTIQQYELGKRQPRLEQLQTIASVLGVRIDDLLGVEEFDTGEGFEKRRAEILGSASKEEITVVHAGSPGAMLKQVWNEMNENGHEKVAEYAADILPTHRK